MCVADRDPPGPAEVDHYFSLHGEKLVRAICNCEHSSSIFAKGLEWTKSYMGSRAGRRDWQEELGHDGDYVRPFVLLAALKFGCGKDRWQTFVEHAGLDVSKAPKDPELKYALEFEQNEFLQEQMQYLSNQLKDAKREVPHRAWLWRLYRLSFPRFHRNQPEREPVWWDKVLGPKPPSLAALITSVTNSLPHPLPGPNPRQPIPPTVRFLPDDHTLKAFVAEEDPGKTVLSKILNNQREFPVELERVSVRLNALEFIYIRYRNSPAAGVDADPTPYAKDLVKLLKEHDYATPRQETERPIDDGYIHTILTRVRKRVREACKAAIAQRELAVGPDPETWVKKVLPNPEQYAYGELFPPLPCRQDRGQPGVDP